MIPSPTRRSRRLRFAASAGVLSVALLLTACGGDDDDTDAGSDETSETTAGDGGGYGDPGESSDSTEADDTGGNGATLTIEGLQYTDVAAAAGSTLTIENNSGSLHTFTSDDGTFDVEVPDGESATVDVPAEPGEYPFHCEIHPSMAATLTVE